MIGRRRIVLSIAGATVLGGCLDEGSDDEGGSPDDEDANAPEAAEIGTWEAVTERTATRPTRVGFADAVRFDGGPYADDVEWHPDAGHRFVLLEVELRVTDAPSEELIPFPDPFAYRVRADERTVEPRDGPSETTVIAEPVSGGYANGGGGEGAENVTTTDWLAFEVPDGVHDSEVRVEYETDDGERLRWEP